MIALSCLLIGLYIVLESIIAASEMDSGDKPCRMAKYLLSGAAGMIIIFYQANLQHLIFGLAIAAFTWPKVVKRIHTL